jgi:hypothetical protein
MDDGAAREEWGWQPTYGLADMTLDMLDKLRAKLLAHRVAPAPEAAGTAGPARGGKA